MTKTGRRVVITGFMGAGKSTVAAALGRSLGCDAVDLDDVITRDQGRTPQQLIDEDGEARFREVETRALSNTLTNSLVRIIALGGGAWTLERNRRLVQEHGCVSVWLDAPFELCWRRIRRHVTEDRPNARSRSRAVELFNTRHPLYALADLRIPVTRGRNIASVVADIRRALDSQ
jgi:shikimate kinase